ncbi:MAG: amidophosphoribosyltransferase, partial [Hydrogenophaga sp.]|nr:amidophosphoribosyltransferase [Hydrogenophaga sp.]
MCGIVGLLLKKPELHSQLGELMVPMLIGMHDRGPDSAGMAVFGQPLPEGQRKLSLYSGLTDAAAAYDWVGLADALNADLKVKAHIQTKGNHAVFTFDGPAEPVKAFIKAFEDKLHILSTGRRIDL